MELSLNNLTKKYGSFIAVNKQNFMFKTGVYGLLGINGAGKTTLMHMICTLNRPTTGNITYKGKDIFEMGDEYRKLIGYLPQEYGYYPDLTVWDYMMHISCIKGLELPSAKKRAVNLLEYVGMKNRSKTKMRQLSGGMLRRVGIAQAMLNNPEILILDEPTAGLDPKERIKFRNLISEISNDRLVLLSTHIVSDVEFVAEEIILMNKGEFFLTGSSEFIISSMEKKVWTCFVQKQEVDKYMNQYLIANIKTLPQVIELRVLSEYPPLPEARQEKPTLEDAFLFYFGEKGVSDYDN